MGAEAPVPIAAFNGVVALANGVAGGLIIAGRGAATGAATAAAAATEEEGAEGAEGAEDAQGAAGETGRRVAQLLWQLLPQQVAQGATEGAPFIASHIIKATEKVFDDFAGTGADEEFNKKILGL